MELFAGLADEFDQTRLDVHMNVFQGLAPRERVVLDFCPNFVQPVDDGGAFLSAENTDREEHVGVCDGPFDVVAIQPFVEVHRCREPGDELVRGLRKTTAPHAVRVHRDGAIRRVGHGLRFASEVGAVSLRGAVFVVLHRGCSEEVPTGQRRCGTLVVRLG